MRFLVLFSLFLSLSTSFGMDYVIDIHEDETSPNSIESIKKDFEENCACSNENIVNGCFCLATTGGTYLVSSNCTTSFACGLLLFIGASCIAKDDCLWYRILKKDN